MLSCHVCGLVPIVNNLEGNEITGKRNMLKTLNAGQEVERNWITHYWWKWKNGTAMLEKWLEIKKTTQQNHKHLFTIQPSKCTPEHLSPEKYSKCTPEHLSPEK